MERQSVRAIQTRNSLMNYEQIKAMSSGINPTMSQQDIMYVVQRSTGQSPQQVEDTVGLESESAVCAEGADRI
ncbi:hypothetical protein O9992_28540 [Vibrio lentus]|nr:hypothetical protein [Vibrio lentus]